MQADETGVDKKANWRIGEFIEMASVHNIQLMKWQFDEMEVDIIASR